MEATFRAKLINALGWIGLCTITVMVLIASGSSSDRDMRAEAMQHGALVVTNSLADVVAHPVVTQTAEQTNQAVPRPRTLKEAMLRQDGHTFQAGLNTKATPFGEYDAVVVKRIQDSWYTELDAMQPKPSAAGKVIVQFNLHANGTVTDCIIVEKTAPQEFADLCGKVISTSAPFPPFSNDMRRMIGGDTRQIQFTFDYF